MNGSSTMDTVPHWMRMKPGNAPVKAARSPVLRLFNIRTYDLCEIMTDFARCDSPNVSICFEQSPLTLDDSRVNSSVNRNFFSLVLAFLMEEQLVKGARTAGWRLKEFDREHAVVHRVTEGTKQAWRGVKEVSANGAIAHTRKANDGRAK